MESRDTCIFYRSMYEAIKELPKEVQAEIYDAIFSYSLDFTEPELTGISRTVWTLIRPVLEKGNRNYINGSKPKRSETEAKPKRLGSETEATLKPNGSEVEAYKDKDKDKEKDKEKKTKEPKSKSDFVLLVDSKKYFGNDPTLKELFVDFIDMRIRIKKTPTEKALDLLANKLRELSKGNKAKAMKIIENSIERNWAGFFDIDSPTSFSKPIQPTFSRAANGVHFSGANSIES
jgi:hypothetical protein